MVMFEMLDTFKRLDTIEPHDRQVVGGKAFNCARLKQAGFPVPDGIVIPCDATDESIQLLAAEPWLDSIPAGTRFAVRSSGIGEDSAGHSFAGIHETQLDVERDQLVEAVVVCRRSAASDQANAYRRARNLGDEAAQIAVLVQRMVPAVTSGVAFTVNPITGADELVVNAAWGLGEALVSGRVDPDEFRISKRDATVLSARPATGNQRDGDTTTLSASQLVTLADLLGRIEAHYGAPQDVEWCHDGEQFWIVQSRPVTTRIANPELRNPQSEIRNVPHDIEWTRANLAEVFPDQLSPQVLAAYEEMLNRAQRQFMGRILAPDAELGPMFKSFRGRMYMNLSQMRRVASLIGAPVADMLRSLGHPEQIHPDDELPKRAPFREIRPAIRDFLRVAFHDATAERMFRRHQAHIAGLIAQLARVDPRTLDDRAVWDAIQWWLQTAPDSIQIVFVMSGVLTRETALRKACAAVGFPYEKLVYSQLAAGARSVSTRQAIDLVALADIARREPAARSYLLENDGTFGDYRLALAGTAFLHALDRFLDQYGHRGRYESDWAIPRLHEDPSPALFAIQGHLQGRPVDLKLVADRQAADAAGAWRGFEARLTRWQRWTLLPRVRATLTRLKKQYVWREQVRSDLTRVLRYGRAYHLVLAERFVERGWIARRDDYFLLRFEEIAPAIADPSRGPGLMDIAARRTAQLAAERDLQMPMLMRESELATLLGAARADGVDGGDELVGLCVSPGSVEAEVVVMRDPSEFKAMKRGAILVAPATDPSWTPLFTLASGVIVEVGGMLSHASTIAREYGLPALANVKHATRVFTTGERVVLDASAGRVYRGGRKVS
jgi:rifampicin phosphotransferase